MDAFLAARQQPGVDSVHQALLCLKSGTEAENKLRLSFVNPNPVTLIAGLPHIGVPDRRDRIRQLGIEGVRDEEVYVLIDDPDQSRTRVQIFRSRLPEGYNDSFFWKATLCDTGFLFFETDEPDTLQISIPYGLTTSWERIRNSRFEKLVPSGLQVTTTSPESGSLVNSLEVLLEWEGSPGLFSEGKSPRAVPEITEYRVYFAPMITENYPEPTTVATTSLLKTGLNYNTEYKWKILAVQNDGQTAISQEATFRTLQDPTPDPNLVAVNAAIALARGANPIALLPVPGGNAATQTQKEAAVKAYLQALPGMGGLGVNISVVWNPLTGEYLVTISKGGVSQSMTIAVTAYADSTPDQTAVDTAIGLVNGDDPIASLAVSGGATGTEIDKEAAVKAYLEGLPGMAGLGVTIAVAWNGTTYDVTITKGSETATTTVAVTGYTDSTPDQTAVDNAIGLVDADDPIASISVSGGSGGSTADKEAAVKAHLESLTGMAALDVTIAVAWNGTDYTVTITKGSASESTTIAVSAYKGLEEFTEGSGTEGDPYMIENWYQLDAVRNDLTAHYKLKNTLDKDTAGYTELASSVADGGKGWNPIGVDINTSFLGVFDGDGKLIKDARINRPTTPNVGIFGHVGNSLATTVVKNVGMQNTEVRGARGSGTLIGRVTGQVNTVVENCFSSGGFVYGDAATGGLVGSFNSYRENPGQAENFRPIMRRCYADIDVYFSGNGTNNIKFGGLVGCAQKGFVGDSYARGSVTASTGCERVGGIAGCIYLQGRLVNTYSTGVVTGGGAINVGGHVGFNAPGNESGSSTGSYWDTQSSGQPSSAVGTGKTTSQMKLQATFVGWDFTTIWDIDGVTNDGYPFLRDLGVGITLASRMEVQTQPGDNLATKPVVRLMNSAGYLVAGDSTTVVTVEIRKVTEPGVLGDPIAGILTGTTSITASGGVANFADLGISGAESGEYVLRFSAPGLDTVNSEVFNVD